MKLLNLEEYLTPESIKVHDINQWDSFLFNLLEEENIYPPKLTGQWITDKNRFYEKFVCLKEVTENTYYPMYCRQYNPIEITIYHEKNGLYDFKIKDIVKGLMICTFISGFLIGILSVLILIYSTI